MTVTITLTSKVLSMGTDSRKLWYISLYTRCQRERMRGRKGEREREWEREERRGREREKESKR